MVADDTETYHCYVFNKFGSNSASGQLVVLSKPFIVISSDVYDAYDNNRKKKKCISMARWHSGSALVSINQLIYSPGPS